MIHRSLLSDLNKHFSYNGQVQTDWKERWAENESENLQRARTAIQIQRCSLSYFCESIVTQT